jgi:hypothetical protein
VIFEVIFKPEDKVTVPSFPTKLMAEIVLVVELIVADPASPKANVEIELVLVLPPSVNAPVPVTFTVVAYTSPVIVLVAPAAAPFTTFTNKVLAPTFPVIVDAPPTNVTVPLFVVVTVTFPVKFAPEANFNTPSFAANAVVVTVLVVPLAPKVTVPVLIVNVVALVNPLALFSTNVVSFALIVVAYTFAVNVPAALAALASITFNKAPLAPTAPVTVCVPPNNVNVPVFVVPVVTAPVKFFPLANVKVPSAPKFVVVINAVSPRATVVLAPFTVNNPNAELPPVNPVVPDMVPAPVNVNFPAFDAVTLAIVFVPSAIVSVPSFAP